MIGCFICLSLFLLVFAFMFKVLHVRHKHENDYHLIIVNEQLSGFNLPTLANLDVMVDQNVLQDKLNLINIWSSNCRPCRQEHLILLKISEYLKSKKINFIGLNYNDDPERATAWLTIHGDPYKINLFDQEGQLVADLGVGSLPELFIVDKHKKIKYKYSGIITMAMWEKNILPILEQLYDKPNK
jgi:cytochrome c biogenesis protein CcmG/thiol:disulfide interchange protein DsbE